jgi:hypothetical protein
VTRTIIGVVVAVVIAALTATAYFVVSSQQNGKIHDELMDRVQRAQAQIIQGEAIESLRLIGDVEVLAASETLRDGLNAITPDAHKNEPNWQEAPDAFQKLQDAAQRVFAEFLSPPPAEGGKKATPPRRPDLLALCDSDANAIYVHGSNSRTGLTQFKPDGKVILPALAEVLQHKNAISEITRLPDIGLARLAVASIVDHDPVTDTDIVRGAVVLAYAISANAAQDEDGLLGVRVAYFDKDHVSATSFTREQSENTEMQSKLNGALDKSGMRERTFDDDPNNDKAISLDIAGSQYYAAAARLPRSNRKDLTKGYPRQEVGAMVLIGVGDEASAFTQQAKTFILVLGGGALVVALFGMYLVHRRMESQIDEIETGVTEIINGNLDRTFRPVGSELDGLANGLNVMLARLLGRPEPGEEAFDENGNPIIPGKVDFEDAGEGAAPQQTDPDLAALAQEPEPDYYKRVFTEYKDARTKQGSPDDVSFESFIAKLRVNEGKLKAQYNCRAVRFRVVMKDGKVTLKPVPIF